MNRTLASAALVGLLASPTIAATTPKASAINHKAAVTHPTKAHAAAHPGTTNKKPEKPKK